MATGTLYLKTALGSAEVANRKLKLAPRLRTMLILIDGIQPEFILREEAAKVGAPDDFLDVLMAKGLIAKVGDAAKAAGLSASNRVAVDEFTRFREARDFMNVTVVDALGLKSFFFTLKLERAGNCADLRELVDTYRASIEKAEGTAQADVLVGRLQELLKP